MPGQEEPPAEPQIEDFLVDPTYELPRWRWLWEGDHKFPRHRDPGLLGRLKFALKRIIRKLVYGSEADLWERQRLFNWVVIHHLERLDGVLAELGDGVAGLGRDLQGVQGELSRDLKQMQADYLRDREAMTERVEHLEKFLQSGLADIMRHNDALFSRVDQKLDRLRRQVRGPREPAG